MPTDASLIIAALLLINGLAYLLMYYDKQAARNRIWRIPERSFAILALIGGLPAILIAMRHFRHKTVKRSFQLKCWVALPIQLLTLWVWLG